MKRDLLEIYALSICFFTVACFVFALGLILWNVVELSVPEFTIANYQYECHQTDDKYRKCYSPKNRSPKKFKREKFPTGKALTEKRKAAYKNVLKSVQRHAWQGIVQKMIIIIIDIFLFIIHWRIAGRVRAKTG